MIITISGTPGSGKSTIAKVLAKKLDFKHYSIGDFMRELAEEKGMTLEEFSKQAEKSVDIDKKLDEKSKKLGSEENNFVMDTRLGFHFIPNSFKIRLIVDSKIGAERIFKDSRRGESFESVEEAKEKIEKRIASERKRYAEYYNIDIDDENNFDLVIDTSDKNPEEIVGEIIKKLNLKIN